MASENQTTSNGSPDSLPRNNNDEAGVIGTTPEPPPCLVKRPQIIDEIRNSDHILRRRRSYDIDPPAISRQFSHHQHACFQDEVLKACRCLQDDADGEKQALLAAPNNIKQTSTLQKKGSSSPDLLLSNNDGEKQNNGTGDGTGTTAAYFVDETGEHFGGLLHHREHAGISSTSSSSSSSLSTGAAGDNNLFGDNAGHHQVTVVSPPPPSIVSFTGASIGAPHHHQTQTTAYCKQAQPCCWLLSVVYFWLFSPSRLAYFARIAGITAGVLSAFFSSLNYAISEYLEGEFDPVEIFAWRQSLMIAFCFPVTAYYQKPMYFKRSELRLWWPMVVRSVGSAFAVLFIYLAIEFIPLSDATVVSNAAPIFCSLIARIFLKEPFGLAEILCAVAVFCGVTLNAQPAWLFDFSLFTADLQKRLIGLAFALGGAFATASTTVIMRTMKSVHFSTQQLMFGYISTVLTWPFVFLMGVARLPPCDYGQKFIILASGFTAVPAQALLIYACQNEKAGIVSLARSTMPVFSLIFQITLFGILPDIYSILGNLIILGAIMGLAVKMLLESRKDPAKNLIAAKHLTTAQVTETNACEEQPSPTTTRHHQHPLQIYVKLFDNDNMNNNKGDDQGGNGGGLFATSPNCTVISTTTAGYQARNINVVPNVSFNDDNLSDDSEEKSA